MTFGSPFHKRKLQLSNQENELELVTGLFRLESGGKKWEFGPYPIFLLFRVLGNFFSKKPDLSDTFLYSFIKKIHTWSVFFNL